MRVKKSTSKSRSSLGVLGIFCAIVFVAIMASLAYRLFGLIETSKYDPAHTFLLAFSYKNDLDIIAVRPHGETSSHLVVRGARSLGDARLAAGIIPDGVITLHRRFSDLRQTSHLLSEVAMHGQGQTDLNIYDLIRLSLATQRLSPESLSAQIIQVSEQGTPSSLPQDFFSDQTISQENKTVAIINGTGVPGLGTRLEEAISQLGGNVISVTNSTEEKEHSSISYADKSYTLSHISSLLDLTPELTTKQGLSDIIILIGKDRSDILSH